MCVCHIKSVTDFSIVYDSTMYTCIIIHDAYYKGSIIHLQYNFVDVLLQYGVYMYKCPQCNSSHEQVLTWPWLKINC